MKIYNYTYDGQSMQKSIFDKNVPKDWEQEYDQLKGYSWGYFSANEIQNDEEE